MCSAAKSGMKATSETHPVPGSRKGIDSITDDRSIRIQVTRETFPAINPFFCRIIAFLFLNRFILNFIYNHAASRQWLNKFRHCAQLTVYFKLRLQSRCVSAVAGNLFVWFLLLVWRDICALRHLRLPEAFAAASRLAPHMLPATGTSFSYLSKQNGSATALNLQFILMRQN